MPNEVLYITFIAMVAVIMVNIVCAIDHKKAEKDAKKMGRNLFWNKWAVPLATGIGVVGGLFAFSLILGVLFMDYDPMTMVYNIARDLKEIFG